MSAKMLHTDKNNLLQLCDYVHAACKQQATMLQSCLVHITVFFVWILSHVNFITTYSYS